MFKAGLMKTHFKNLFLLPALIAGLGLMQAGRLKAQTFTILHSFKGGSDGSEAYGGLFLSGTTLYGESYEAGTGGYGNVYCLNTNGTGFTNLYSFTNGSDGAYASTGFVLSGGTLYSMAYGGGAKGDGTVFSINTNGTGFQTRYTFTNGSDGSFPYEGVIVSGDTLYGTAYDGGTAGHGTVFSVNTNGSGFTTLHSFTNGADGANPADNLILCGNTLYGTADGGGAGGYGTVFSINTNGTGFQTRYTFTNGSDGAYPYAGLILSGGTLYGTTEEGGADGYGTVFSINTNGGGFTTLYTFTDGSDGSYPYAALILSDNTLYGTAEEGGNDGYGTVFSINTDGTGFTTLYTFTDGNDGAYPYAALTLSDNTLYGTAEEGGADDYGTVFSLSLPPSPSQLVIIPTGPYVILSWPVSTNGFTLQSTTNLAASSAWTNVAPEPVVIGGQNIIINTMSGAQQFYRLRR
jgi:uncharacterized repeat protein (TIGR03803 family)